jgi:predicted TIM-barrel fold metal-dependent hydrolase
MSGYELISADSHVLEPGDLFEQRLPASLRDRAPRLVDHAGGSAWVVGDLDPVPLPASVETGSGYRTPDNEKPVKFSDALPALYDPTARLAAQDADSVDAEVLYPSPGLWDALTLLGDLDLHRECAKVYNDWITEFCAFAPSRLVGVAKLPLSSQDDAQAEAVRAVKDLGLKGLMVDDWPGGAASPGPIAENEFWATINELGAPITLHFAVSTLQPSTPSDGISPGLRPQAAEKAQPLVVARLFDRFPDVRFVIAHGDAGWAMHWLEFLDINYVRMRHLEQFALEDPDKLPSEYVRDAFWFTFNHDRSAVKNRSKIGINHLMWASHFPLDTTDWPDNHQAAMLTTEEIPAEDRQALLADNTAKLYRLPGSESGFSGDEVRLYDQLVYF